jgi:hypothetical protein
MSRGFTVENTNITKAKEKFNNQRTAFTGFVLLPTSLPASFEKSHIKNNRETAG